MLLFSETHTKWRTLPGINLFPKLWLRNNALCMPAKLSGIWGTALASKFFQLRRWTRGVDLSAHHAHISLHFSNNALFWETNSGTLYNRNAVKWMCTEEWDRLLALPQIFAMVLGHGHPANGATFTHWESVWHTVFYVRDKGWVMHLLCHILK